MRTDTPVDGRTAGRERNRDAVVDAMLDLYGAGIMSPSADDIAAQSGVSRRSVFRYFEDLDDLCRAAIARQKDRVGHLFLIQGSGIRREERIEAMVQHRFRLFAAIAPVARVARMRAPVQPILDEQLRADGGLLRQQLEQHFEPDLRDLDPVSRARVAAAADILTSFEAYEILVGRQGKTPDEAAAVMRQGLSAVIPG